MVLKICVQTYVSMLSLYLLQRADDDDISEMSSGLAASTVDSRGHEQDLAGFPEVEHSRQSMEHSRQGVEHSRQSASLEHSRLGPAQADKEVLATATKLDSEPRDGQAHVIGTSVHPAAVGPQTVRVCLLCSCLFL